MCAPEPVISIPRKKRKHTRTKRKGRYTMTEEKKNKKEMSEAAKAARNAYKRRWAKENPDKVKAANRRYWERKAQALTAEEG